MLDLRQDRYFAVPGSLTPSALAWLERGFSCAPPEDVAGLLGRSGIVRSGDPEPTNALKERIAVPSGLDAPRSRGGPTLSRARQSAAIAATWMRLRMRPLHQILKERELRGGLPARGPTDAVSSLAAEYELGRSYTPITRNCLLDSLALDRLLFSKDLGATLVFGVCPTPFSAHCWLQTPDLILNDTFDHVSRFTPIYAA